jgi:hypothetical protein
MQATGCDPGGLKQETVPYSLLQNRAGQFGAEGARSDENKP